MTATEEWLKSLGKVTGAQTALGLSVDDRKPDDLAEQMRLGQQLGVPPVVVASDPDGYRARAAQKASADLLANAPLTAKWLQDRTNGGLAKDDIENLSWFEKNIVRSPGALTRAAGRGVVRTGAMVPALEAEITGSFVGDMGKTVDQIYAEEMVKFGSTQNPIIQADARRKAQMRFDALDGMTAQNKADALAGGADALQRARAALDRSSSIPKSEGGQRFQVEVLDKAENSLMGVLKAFASDPVGGAAFIAETAAETLPLLLASTGVTLATRNPAAGISIMAGGSFLLENSSGAMDFLTEKGVDLSTPEAALAVLENSELMAEATQRGLSRGLVIALFDAVSGGVAGQTLMKSAGGEVVVQGIAQMAFGAGGEAAAQVVAGQDLSWKDIVVEGLAELATAPIEVGGVAGRGLIQRLGEWTKSGATAERLAAIDEKATASKLRERDPARFKDLLDQVGGDQFLYVPAEDLQTYFQAKDTGFDPADWGIDPNDYAEQLATGGNVAIPVSAYAAKAPGTADADWFRDNAVFNLDEMSVSEAARFNEEVRGVMDEAMAESDRTRVADLQTRASDVQVYDGLYSQLRAAGRGVDVAMNEARAMTAFFRSMASRYGEDALDLARRFGLAIEGPAQAPNRRRGQLDIAINTLRRGAPKSDAQSLTDFVVARGGVRDIGGDLEAMGVPKGVIAETRAQYLERGQQPSMLGLPEGAKGDTLDNIARAAVAAGYFPELAGQEVEGDITGAVMEALREEVAGRKTYAVGDAVDTTLTDLADELSRRGLDIAALSNDEIVAALDAPVQGDTYGQDGRLVTDSAAFREWFGDSKVVGPDGAPKVVYHGSVNRIGYNFAFSADKIGAANDDGFFGRGFYLTEDRRLAEQYAYSGGRERPENLVSAYVSMQNPFIYNDYNAASLARTNERLRAAGVTIEAMMGGVGDTNAAAFTEQLKAAGFDGVIVAWDDAGTVINQLIAFAPTQIKSVFNRGTFDAADPRILYQVSPDQARQIDMQTALPDDPLFAEAVGNTDGAEITEDGLLIDLVRYQKPEQVGATSVRTGVFYLPTGSKNAKFYNGKGSLNGAYGGAVEARGKTLVKRPLFVKGGTGGKAPEAAYDAIKGKGAIKALYKAVMLAVTSSVALKRNPGLFEENVSNFLEEFGADGSMAYEIIENSKQGNQLRYALQENVIAHAVREAGYDSVIGYTKGKAGAGIAEVFDVREIDYPVLGEQAILHPMFEGRTLYQAGAGLASVEQVARDTGVELSLSESNAEIRVSKIVAATRGEGAGTKVMEALTAYADASGKQISLTPSADFGGSVARLKAFYKRFGFVENRGRNKDFGTRETMIRPASQRTFFQATPEMFSDYLAVKAEASRLRDELKNPEKTDAQIKSAFDKMIAVGPERAKLAEVLAAEDGGLELKAKDGHNAAISKSQDGKGGWRVTYFGPDGFFGHTEYTTKVEAIKDALQSGYDELDTGALRRAMKSRTFFQTAYHGSPHLFDKFSLDKIGTGEGAQAFGWGLYFAGRKKIAEYYREKLSGGKTLSMDGQDASPAWIAYAAADKAKSAVPLGATDFTSGAETYDYYFRVLGADAEYALRMVQMGHSDGRSIQEEFDKHVSDRFAVDPPYDDEVSSANAIAAAIRTELGGANMRDAGRLFKVDIPEDKDLLDWDAPLKDQSESVLAKLRPLMDRIMPEDEALLAELGVDTNATATGQDPALEMTGSQFYQDLADRMGAMGWPVGATATQRREVVGSAHKRASEALRAAGVPGHRFLDGNSRADGDGTRNYVIYDEDAVRVLEFEQTKRGQITFPSGGLDGRQSVIRLFENADLSTVWHEFGHYSLEVFTALATDANAPQGMKDDLAAIQKYLKAGGTKYSTDQHETWARSFEAYAMEGKAPSLELADAFARMKAWLTRIYQAVKGLNVKLTPEVREVMDRLLATDAEIEATRAAQGMKPLFTDEAAAGMSPEAFKTYQRIAQRSVEQAQASLLEKTMAKVRREKEAWWKAEYKTVLAEVTSMMNTQRPYRLVEMLANKQWLGDTARDVPDIQINRDELVEAFGEGVLAELSRSRLGGKRAIYAKDGASMMEVADLFGFANPQEMVDALQNAGKRKDAIRNEANRIMTDRYGDPFTDGTIEQEALDAIHSEQQAKTVAAEVRHLAKRANLPTRNLTSQVFRQRAKLMIGRMAVGEATKPDAFLGAERKAAKRAEDAFARVARGGGQDALVAATRHKEQQLLNHYLYLESRDLTKMVESGREKMRAYDKATVRKKLEGGYIEQIDALLDDYDFRVRGKKQIARAESLAAFVQRMTDEGRAGELSIDPRLIEQAQRKHYSRLSVDELRGLFDTIDNLDHLGRFKQKLIDARRKRELDESVNAITGLVSANLGAGKAKQTSILRDTFNLMFTMDTMLVELDGFDEMGRAYSELKSDIDYGASLEQKMQVDLSEKLDGLFKVYSPAELKAMQKPKSVAGSNGRLWSKVEVLAVALNMGNADNRARMFEQTAHEQNRLTPDQADALVATMDKRDWEFVQSMWDLVNSYYPELAAVHKRRTGTTLNKVEAVPVETPFGTFAGGYYPIKYDSELSAVASKDESTAWDRFLSSGWGAKADVKSGMTKDRQSGSGGRTLMLDLSPAFTHLKDTVRLIALSEAVDNTYRILNDRRVMQAFIDAGRKSELDVMNLWLKDVAQGPVQNSDVLDRFARVVKNNFTLSRLAFNMKTVALQVTGLAQSAAVIGKKNLALGMMDYRKRPRELAAEVIAKSSFMAERRTSFQKDIYDFANDVELSSPLASGWKKAKNQISQAGFYPMIAVQFYAVDMPTWLGAYRAGLEKFSDDAKAVQFADRLVARSADSGLMADRSAISRGTLSKGVQQADFVRIFTTLGGYMIAKMNRGYIAAARGKKDISEAQSARDKVLAATEAATNLVLLYVMEGAFMALMYAMAYGGDDDERDPEDYAKFIAKETAMSMVAGIPLIRDAATAFQGYGAGGVIGSVLELPANLYVQTMQGENDKALRRSMADMIGTVTGMPTTATMRAIEQGLSDDTPSLAEGLFGSNPIGR